MLRVLFVLILLFLVWYPLAALGNPRFAPVGTEVRIVYPGIYCTNKEALLAIYEQRSNDFDRGQYELLAHSDVCAMPPAGQEVAPRTRIEAYEQTWVFPEGSFALVRARWQPEHCTEQLFAEGDGGEQETCERPVTIYILVHSIEE